MASSRSAIRVLRSWRIRRLRLRFTKTEGEAALFVLCVPAVRRHRASLTHCVKSLAEAEWPSAGLHGCTSRRPGDEKMRSNRWGDGRRRLASDDSYDRLID
jgi:hypothetical protein